MNPIATQQAALDNALVPPKKRLKIERCNARIAFSKPQTEETYQVTLKALILSPCYPAFLITTEDKTISKRNMINLHTIRDDSLIDEGNDTILGVLDVPKNQYESENESWGDNEDDIDDNSDDDTVDEVTSMMNVKNRQEESSTQAPSLFTMLETTIPATLDEQATTVPPTISMMTPLPQLTTPSPAPKTIPTITSIPALLDFSSLKNMNPIATQQAALDNALVPPKKRLKIERCNARIAFSKPQTEETYQVTLKALILSPCYPAFLITTEVPKIYMHQFWTTIKEIENYDAYNFKLEKKKYRVDTEFFHEIL
nr:hypothetical protein [Tanacetum cinerariifolium]